MATTRAPRRTISRTMARVAGLTLAAGFLAGFGLAPSVADAKPPVKVTICHATSSTSNPYVKVTVPASSVDGKGKNDHTSHTGGLFDFSNPAGNAAWGDIIPDVEGAAFSMNATESGLGIFDNGCNGPDEGSCPDGSDPVGGECPTEETCPSGQPATGGECDETEVDVCESDAELLADDPLCGVEVGDGGDDVACESDATLLADDPLCGVEVGDGGDDVACESDATLLADDPLCGVELGDGGDDVACESDATLLADDPLCGAVDQSQTVDGDDDVCATDDSLAADDPACGEQEELPVVVSNDDDHTPQDGGSDPGQTPTVDDESTSGGSGVQVLGSVINSSTQAATRSSLPMTGSDSAAMVVAGFALIALGVGFALWSRLTRA